MSSSAVVSSSITMLGRSRGEPARFFVMQFQGLSGSSRERARKTLKTARDVGIPFPGGRYWRF